MFIKRYFQQEFDFQRTVFHYSALLQGPVKPLNFVRYLKEYYEIVDEARPLSGFFSHTC